MYNNNNDVDDFLFYFYHGKISTNKRKSSYTYSFNAY